MNLYEFEGKQLFEKHGITIPRGVVLRRNEDVPNMFEQLNIEEVVVKAQVLSGKRGKNNAIRFCSSQDEVAQAVEDLFAMNVRGQYVAAVRIEEKLDIAEEQYLSITYDTNAKQPVAVYSAEGGVDIEEVDDEKIEKQLIDVRAQQIPLLELVLSGVEGKEEVGEVSKYQVRSLPDGPPLTPSSQGGELQELAQQLWNTFLNEDARLVEINPLVKTVGGDWIAADAKVALDDDAFYRHTARDFAPRTMLGRPATEREIAVAEIDTGEKYYQGTAGKYIELDGDIAVLFSGGGASIANMDALKQHGLEPANYTEYSGNPPREKVFELAKIVLSKPGLRGLWICGGVANFTNVEATFQGIVDALDEVKPRYPIVVRRAGPHEKEGMQLMADCAEKNGLNMKLFGKEMGMSESAGVLVELISN